MKKNIITIVLALLITTLQAQIKPKLKIGKTTNIKKGPGVQALKVDRLKKITINDFQNLKIPIATISKEKLNAKPIKTWKINPLKLKDGFLQLLSFQGKMTATLWSYGGQRTSVLRWDVETLTNGGVASVMPLKIKFRVSGGIEYRIKFKNQNGSMAGNDYIFVAKRSKGNIHISRLTPSEQNEYNYIFKEPSSGEITLEFSAIPSFDPRDEETLRQLRDRARRTGRRFVRRDYWGWVTISEIRIDRIN